MDKKLAPFARWIWTQRHNGLAIHEWVLTNQNSDNSLPKERLSLAEAKSLLLFLEESKLVYSFSTSAGTAYAVHLKERDWKITLKNMKAPRLRPALKTARSVLLWGLLFYLTATLTPILNEMAKDFYKAHIQSGAPVAK